MFRPDNPNEAKGLGEFFKKIGEMSARAVEKSATNVMKNPGIALQFRTKTGSAIRPKYPQAAPSTTLNVISFYHTGKRFLSWKICTDFQN